MSVTHRLSHPWRLSVIAAVAVVAMAGALLWFEPWQLFATTTVSEAVPSAPPDADGSGQARSGPSTLSAAPFRSLEHETSGSARILQLDDGRRFVRLEDFRTSSGPDLVVLLSDTAATEDSWGAYDDGRTALLGTLKGNVGDQNYEVPPGVDLAGFDSVVVWCRRFTVGFGAAPIEAGLGDEAGTGI
jgi:hypothetical protein